MKTTRVKIFQRESYHYIEQDFNAWAEEREKDLAGQDLAEVKDILEIPPQTSLQFDQALQKYIFTVVYHDIISDPTE